jgi:SAM-dependent methyltransferase
MIDCVMRKDIRKIVRDGYEQGDYPGVFRRGGTPNEMERQFLDRLLSLCPATPGVLDLGCGTGLPIDKYLANHGADVTGIDVSPKHIALATANVPSANYVEGDFSRLALTEESFDAVVSFHAIFHIPRSEHGDLFAKIARLLRDGGIFLATLGTSDSEYGEEANWTGAAMAWSTYDPETYKRLLDEAGFAILEACFEGKPGDDEYHYWVLARRVVPPGAS